MAQRGRSDRWQNLAADVADMSPNVGPTRHDTTILATWACRADTYLMMSATFVSATRSVRRTHRHRTLARPTSWSQRSFLGSAATNIIYSYWIEALRQVAEIMSRPVCDWARVDLCQKPQGSVSLIKCNEAGCNRLLHHMCQCMWESDDEDVRQAHGSRKFCAHHHPAGAKKGPPSIVLQEFSQSTMDTMSQITHCPSLPPMGNVNIAGQSLPANGQDCTSVDQIIDLFLIN